MYSVYLIQSKHDGSYYIGQTNNLIDRLKRHNGGHIKTTRSRKPWKLIKSEGFDKRRDAMWKEYLIKTRKKERDKFIEK